MNNQEYILGIIGGCFPVQEQIKHDELYHQLIAHRLLDESGINLRTEISRYDLINECEEAFNNIISKVIPDILLFHVRPDPYLINSKVYARFVNKNKIKTSKINLHKLSGFKEPDLIAVNTRDFNGRKKRKQYLRKIFRELNYLAGILSGNNSITIDKFVEIIYFLKSKCESRNIKLIVQGPPSRPRSKMENYLLNKLNKKLFARLLNSDIEYIPCFGEYDEDGNYIFLGDNIHLSSFGHKKIAGLLYPAIKEYFVKKNPNEKKSKVISSEASYKNSLSSCS
jgi:hypothetical protein